MSEKLKTHKDLDAWKRSMDFGLRTLDYGLWTGSVSPVTHHSSVDEVPRWAGAFKDGEKEK